MPKAEAQQLADKDVDKMLKQIKEVREFLSSLEKIGADIPSPLTTSLKNLERLLKAGKAVGDSAYEASDALEKFTKDLRAACKNVDDAQQTVCEAGVERQWQARSVSFTLSPNNKNSVISKLIDKAIRSYTPEMICKYWEKCAKTAK